MWKNCAAHKGWWSTFLLESVSLGRGAFLAMFFYLSGYTFVEREGA